MNCLIQRYIKNFNYKYFSKKNHSFCSFLGVNGMFFAKT